jgi:hypothetical protein
MSYCSCTVQPCCSLNPAPVTPLALAVREKPTGGSVLHHDVEGSESVNVPLSHFDFWRLGARCITLIGCLFYTDQATDSARRDSEDNVETLVENSMGVYLSEYHSAQASAVKVSLLLSRPVPSLPLSTSDIFLIVIPCPQLLTQPPLPLT